MIYISESLYISCNESIYTLIYSKYKKYVYSCIKYFLIIKNVWILNAIVS